MPSNSSYSPAGRPAVASASLTRTDRSTPLARMTVRMTAGRQVVAVEDEAGAQAVFGQLVPDVVGVAPDDGVRPVAQVRGPARPGVDGGPDLVTRGGGVADRDEDPIGHDARMYGMAASYSGERVTIRTRPPAASCQRRYSSMSGGRMCRNGCAPRGPSSRARCGPSTWIPTIDAATSGSCSQASATDLIPSSIRGADSVQIVMHEPVTPSGQSARTIDETTAPSAPAALGSWPPYPLIWMSVQPGGHPHVVRVDVVALDRRDQPVANRQPDGPAILGGATGEDESGARADGLGGCLDVAFMAAFPRWSR